MKPAGTALPIDHAIVAVADLGAARALLEGLGFTVTPPSTHSAAMGTANCCVVLDGAYVEFIAVVAETPLNAPWRETLARGGGLAGVAVACADIARDRAALEAAGLAPGEPLSFSRRDEALGGELAFEILRLAGKPADIRMVACRHLTPDLLWNARTMRHANGARALHAIRLQALDPEGTRAALGRAAAALGKGTVAVDAAAGPGRLLLSADGDLAARARAAGLPIASRDGLEEIDLGPTVPVLIAVEPAR